MEITEGETGGGGFNGVVIRGKERRGILMRETKTKRAREREKE